jgi:hypothetical protein
MQDNRDKNTKDDTETNLGQENTQLYGKYLYYLLWGPNILVNVKMHQLMYKKHNTL